MKKNLFWIYILSSSIYFVQGFEGLPALSLFIFLKERLGFSPEKIMWISAIISTPWVIKPIWGFLSDNYFTKKKWIIFSLLGSVLVSLYFGLTASLPILGILIVAFLGNYNTALRDVSADGIMCVTGKKTKTCDKIQAIQWISITVASIIVGLAGGYIAEHYTYKLAYLCLIPIYLIIIGITLSYKEDKIKKTRESFIKYIVSYKELFTNKSFLWACLFLFLYKFSPSFGTPLSFIQRDQFKWSLQWMGILGAIISSIEIIGAIVFYKYCKKINVRKWLYISVFLGAVTTLCYLYYTPVSAIVYGVCFAVLGMFIHLIVMSFLANSTIKGKEATSFALLCSVNNLAAGTASTMVGAFLFPKVGLPTLIVLSALTSFLCLPLIKHLKIGEQK